MKDILFVHGASSSPLSFNYLRQKLPAHRREDFVYDSNEDIEETIERLVRTISIVPGDIKQLNIIAHSLGGVIATAASYEFPGTIGKELDLKLVTISSPFAGSKAATYLRFLFPGYGLFGNVSTTSSVILGIQERGAKWPTLNVISTEGDSPLLREANDGVISVSSQLSLKKCQQKIHRVNHFEALLSDDIVEDIANFIWTP